RRCNFRCRSADSNSPASVGKTVAKASRPSLNSSRSASVWPDQHLAKEKNMGDFDDVRERGLAVRREMFGPPGSDDAVRNASNFAAPFHEILSRYCFGEFWTR